MRVKNIPSSKYCKKMTSDLFAEKKAEKRLPDLTKFRKSIHVKGEPLSQVVIRGRG